MLYRGWTITVHATYLGYSAEYTSPIGRTYQTPDSLPSEQKAEAYARQLVDCLIECEDRSLRGVKASAEATRPSPLVTGNPPDAA